MLQVPTEVVNCVQSLQLNYLTALLRSGDFTLVYYPMGKVEYIRYYVVTRSYNASRISNVIIIHICLLYDLSRV